MPQLVDGPGVGRCWSFRDITERTRLEIALSHQAFHDSLLPRQQSAIPDRAATRSPRGTTLARGGGRFIDSTIQVGERRSRHPAGKS